MQNIDDAFQDQKNTRKQRNCALQRLDGIQLWIQTDVHQTNLQYGAERYWQERQVEIHEVPQEGHSGGCNGLLPNRIRPLQGHRIYEARKPTSQHGRCCLWYCDASRSTEGSVKACYSDRLSAQMP